MNDDQSHFTQSMRTMNSYIDFARCHLGGGGRKLSCHARGSFQVLSGNIRGKRISKESLKENTAKQHVFAHVCDVLLFFLYHNFYLPIQSLFVCRLIRCHAINDLLPLPNSHVSWGVYNHVCLFSVYIAMWYNRLIVGVVTLYFCVGCFMVLRI